MSDYDILADKVSECVYEGMSPREMTDALLAAGVRPPARVISKPASAEELAAQRKSLDALHVGSIAKTEDLGEIHIWIKEGSRSWREVASGYLYTSHEPLRRCPVTVVHESEATP